jgi:hypothetical protein
MKTNIDESATCVFKNILVHSVKQTFKDILHIYCNPETIYKGLLIANRIILHTV